ncbi:mitochondrial large subunit ribosomal protein-domain-containing protein [Ganoderma leucocontextum]|nr:mitochondrial large subunit ribosomal protein-domain-containing protein [Ganoderma leucocontextum]
MLSSLARPCLASAARQARLYSELASSAAVRSAPSDPLPPVSPHHPISPAAGDLPYLVRRNTKGSIPVYTDIRNGGTKYLVLIRNVEGNVNALVDDLAGSLFPAGSNEAERLKIHTVRQSHVVLSGGRWKNDVIRWLVQKGF